MPKMMVMMFVVGASAYQLTGPPRLRRVNQRRRTVVASMAPGAVQMTSPLAWTRTWALLAGCSAGGLYLEKKTQWGAAISSNVLTMLAALVLANVGILPAGSPTYGVIMRRLAAVAVPLLLLDADIDRVRKDGKRLLYPYFVAAFGTVVGTLVAWPALQYFVPSQSIEDAAIVASGLCARHIGGAVNYVAVCDACRASPNVVAAGIAADNAVVAPYFALLFRLAGKSNAHDAGNTTTTTDVATTDEAAMSIAVALACVAAAGIVFPPNFLLPGCTIAAVFAATQWGNQCRALAPAGRVLGAVAMQFFVAAIGASSGTIRSILAAGGPLFCFSLLQLAVHYGILLAANKIAPNKFDRRSLAVASNAAVGGPTTAAAMCTAKGWSDLVLPALLVGILGYATGTFIALAILQLLYYTLPY